MIRPTSLAGLIKQKWIQAGCPHLDWDDLRGLAIEADNELEYSGLNPAEIFRRHRKNNYIAEMSQYVRGFYKYPFYPGNSYEKSQPEVKPSPSSSSSDPDRDNLVRLYWKLKDTPNRNLRLESELPGELRPYSREQYRITMAMILSERIDDYKLSRALGRLFRKYPDFKDLQDFSSKQQLIERILISVDKGGCGFGGYNKHNGGGNDDRLWTFLNRYFGDWNLRITEHNMVLLHFAVA